MRGDRRWARYWEAVTWRERGAIEAELDNHLALLTDHLIATGSSPEAAVVEARRRMGDRTRLGTALGRTARRSALAARLTLGLDELVTDVGYGLRQARRRPWRAAGEAGSLALAVAGVLVVSMLLGRVTAGPSGVADSKRVAVIASESSALGIPAPLIPSEIVRAIEARVDLFESAAATRTSISTVAAVSGLGASPRFLTVVDPAYFRTLGIRLALGRVDGSGSMKAAGAVVLAHHYWIMLGGDPGLVGMSLLVDGRPLTIVGVTPRGFDGTDGMSGSDGFVIDDSIPGAGHTYQVVARLREGVTLARFQAELAALGSDGSSGPRPDQRLVGFGLAETRLSLAAASDLPALGMIGLGLFGLTLLAACASLTWDSTGLRAGGLADQRVRFALGATRARVALHAALRCLPVSVAGAAVGIGVAALVGQRLLAIDLGLGAPLRIATTLPGGMIGIVLALVALSSTVLPGLTSAHLAGAAESEKRGRADRSRHPVQRAAALIQIAASAALLLAAATFGSVTYRTIAPTGPADSLLVLGTPMPVALEDRANLGATTRELLQVPGVVRVAWTTALPFGRGVRLARLRIGPGGPGVSAGTVAVSPGFFPVLGIPIRAGRDLSVADSVGAEPVAVLSEAAAGQLWPNEAAVGRTVDVSGTRVRIVGTVALGHAPLGGTDPAAAIFVAAAQQPAGPLFLIAGTDPHDPDARSGIMTVVRGAGLRPAALQRLTDLTSSSINGLLILRGASLASLTVSLVGLILGSYGLLRCTASWVAGSHRRLGVMMALGGGVGRVRRTILREGLGMIGAGTGLGIIVWLPLREAARDLGLTIGGTVPLEIVGVALALLAVAGLLPLFVLARHAAAQAPRAVLGSGA